MGAETLAIELFVTQSSLFCDFSPGHHLLHISSSHVVEFKMF